MANQASHDDGGGVATGAGYGAMAEFHDLFMEQVWERLRPHVRGAFAHLPADAVIVELGAGTGMGTRVFAHESPARIAAIEPDLVMRSVLTARVADDPDLAARVTVIAGSVPDDLSLLPTRVDGFICAHMLGHLTAAQRSALFAWIDAHLNETGVGLLTVAREAPAGNAPADEVETRRLGEYEYRAHHARTAADDEFHSRYEVWHGETLLRQLTFVGAWRTVTAADIAAELVPTLIATQPDEGLVLINRNATNAGQELTSSIHVDGPQRLEMNA